MTESWSGSAGRFVIHIDRRGCSPVARQLENGLRDAIRAGRLAGGESLPSSRLLAEELGLSRGLVQGCYEQLVAEGYLTARAGSKTRVADIAMSRAAMVTIQSASPPGFPVADLRPSVPDLSSFPRRDWLRATQESLTGLPNSGLAYPDPAGSPRLRATLADYLRRVRAADGSAAQVLACGGFAQGLHLVVQVLAARGLLDVAVEDPGYGPDNSSNARAVTSAGGRLYRIPVDEEGIEVDHLARTPARLVVVTPAHQSPTGIPMSAERRRALLDWAEARNGYILEDDYDSEYRYDRQALGVLQGMAPERVILIGTVSKTLAPALRLGWVLAPDVLMDDLTDAKQRADRGSSILEQETLGALIRSGRYDRHLRAMRKKYMARRDLLVALLTAHLPHVQVSGLAAGLNLIAHLPDEVIEAELVASAAERGVGLYTMNHYLAIPAATHPRLVIGFGNVTDRQLRAAIPILADILTAAADPRTRSPG